MKRSELLEALVLAEPAVSGRDFVPIFTCFCFDGKLVTAYDDIIAIRTPCETPFVGGVRGDTLLQLIKSSTASDVEWSDDKGELSMKLGRSKIKLPLAQASDFVFVPSASLQGKIQCSDELITSIEACLVSAGVNPSAPERLGITAVFEDTKIILFSTDDQTLSRMECEAEFDSSLNETAVIIPTKFCVNLVDMHSRADGCKTIEVHDGSVVAKFNSKASLTSKTVRDANPAMYVKAFSRYVTKKTKLFGVPESFSRCIDRSLVMLNVSMEKHCEFKVVDNKLSMFTKTSLGEVRDSITLKDDAPDLEFTASPELIKRVLDMIDQIGFHEGCVVTQGGDFIHLISTPTLSK